MSGKIVTVVGGSGFVGRYVVKGLCEAGYTVRVLCRNPSKAQHLKVSGDVGQVVCDYADLAKPETLEGKLNGSYAAINLVGILFESGKQKFGKIQTEGARAVAAEAKQAGVKRFVQMSALGVDKATASDYAKSKLAGEEAVRKLLPQATIVRPSVVFGAEDNFFNMFANMSVFAPALPAIGGGKTTFQPVYVVDVADAIVKAISASEFEGKTYELGGPDQLTFRQLLEYVGDVTGRHRPLAPIPFPIASIMGRFASLLPKPPLTADQVRLLKTDNVVSGELPTFADLGMESTAIDTVVPHYLAHLSKAA